jgi:lysylphosphatidylglycerol synthetase-like protein (DUF2156 family)
MDVENKENIMTSEIKAFSATKGTYRLGFWSAVLLTGFAVVAFAAAIATPPRSGPFCTKACITYPYANAAAFFPRDYLWMVPAIFMMLLFVILTACIHDCADDDKKVFSRVGLSFAMVSAAVITLDYFIQLTVMQPGLLKGEMEGLALFSQYNPHGIFIALEDLGYLMMSLAFLFISVVFARGERLEHALRWLFVISSLVAFAAFIGLTLVYGNGLEYRFEVAIITINWITLIVSGVLLSSLFQRVWKYKGT